MKLKSPKQQLNVIPNPEFELKQKPYQKKQTKMQKPQQIQAQMTSQLPYPAPSPKKREQLKRVQDDIEVMKNKILLLKIQLQKEQQAIKMNKSRTQEVIKKKINVNKIQKYVQFFDNKRKQRILQLILKELKVLGQSHQNQMQNIMKAIYLVKLDDARQIKNISKSHRKKIVQMNQATYNEQLQKKKRIAEQHQRAKQKYERYWKQKLASIYQGETKAKQQIERTMNEKKDELKQLRQQQIKLLQSMNKIQTKQVQTKKQYLAALSLPVKDVAEALNRSKSSMDNSNSIEKTNFKLNRMSSDISKSKNGQNQLTHNFSSVSSFESSIFKDNALSERYKPHKVPNSSVNKQKLSIILKQLKRLDKKEKQQKQSSQFA